MGNSYLADLNFRGMLLLGSFGFPGIIIVWVEMSGEGMTGGRGGEYGEVDY